MGSIDSAFGGSFDGGFEPDDFYESFLAPKFHDFSAPEEPIDPDAYFLSKPGMLKKAFAVEEVNTVAPKVHKVAAQDAPKTTPVSQQQAPPKSPVAAEKTVRVSSAKKTNPVSSPLTGKSLKNGTISATNSPVQQQLPMLDKSLKPTSLVKKLQASENDDPNSPLKSPGVKAAKPALARQRSLKATQEVEKPALTRQRSLKRQEVTKPAVGSQGDSSESGNSEESDQGKGTPLKEHLKSAVVGNGGAVKALKPDHSSTCKTPVKEAISSHSEVKKCTEIAGSPFSGHHCKHSRCAANDPNYASPVPTKKYLVAKKGTPGSIRKATPNHAGVDVPSENPEQSSEVVAESCGNGNGSSVPKVKGHGQVALLEAFNKMALDQSPVEELMTKQVSEPTMSNLKEVCLEEDKKASLSAEDIRDWSRNSVDCEAAEKAASGSSSGRVTPNVESDSDSKPTGEALFLQVASNCLENIDLDKLNVPPTKVAGKKRKSGELLAAGASKKANCASDEHKKAIAKKISQAKESASKAAKMKLKRLSVARRLSVVRSKPGVTNPRPFRLRTQERGAVKEKEFIKKMEEYKAAREGFHSAFQGLAAVEPKIPGKFLKSGHVFSANRADSKDDKEVLKPTIPLAHRAPLFDHPFKPHRSTKKLTVPQEPKFHTVRGSRTCPSHVVVPSA